MTLYNVIAEASIEGKVFITQSYSSLPQSTPIGTTIFRNIQAQDIDAGVNGLVEYFIVESHNETLAEDEKMRSADGYGTFSISFPHQGQVQFLKLNASPTRYVNQRCQQRVMQYAIVPAKWWFVGWSFNGYFDCTRFYIRFYPILIKSTFTFNASYSIQVTVVKTLDYERIQRYYLTIIASASLSIVLVSTATTRSHDPASCTFIVSDMRHDNRIVQLFSYSILGVKWFSHTCIGFFTFPFI